MKVDALTVALLERFMGTIDPGVLKELSRFDSRFMSHLSYWREESRLDLILIEPNPEPENNQDVHTEHCCYNCGCKYGRDEMECTVTDGSKRQSFKCDAECNRW